MLQLLGFEIFSKVWIWIRIFIWYVGSATLRTQVGGSLGLLQGNIIILHLLNQVEGPLCDNRVVRRELCLFCDKTLPESRYNYEIAAISLDYS